MHAEARQMEDDDDDYSEGGGAYEDEDGEEWELELSEKEMELRRHGKKISGGGRARGGEGVASVVGLESSIYQQFRAHRSSGRGSGGEAEGQPGAFDDETTPRTFLTQRRRSRKTVSSSVGQSHSVGGGGGGGGGGEEGISMGGGGRLLRSREGGGGGGGGGGPRGRRARLDGDVQQKLSSVVAEYEGLLGSQLAAQTLLFEKMLAREMVVALERSYRLGHQSMPLPPDEDTSPNPNPNRRGSGKEGKGEIEVGDSREEGRASLSRSGSLEAFSLASFMATEGELAQIERAKVEISSLEQAHSLLLDSQRAVEKKTRRARKDNDTLIRTQKELRERVAELARREVQVVQSCDERTKELQQEIADLAVHTRASALLHASTPQGSRHEMEGGSLVLGQQRLQQTPPTSNNTKDRNGGGSSGKKK